MTLALSNVEGVAIVPRWRLVLPPAHSDWLRRMCVVTEPPENLWLWSVGDLPLLQTVLSQLRFRLEAAADDEGAASRLSDALELLARCYDENLATEDGIVDFSEKLRTCDVEAFGSRVADPLRKILGRAFRGDAVARSLLSYLQERVALSYEWRAGRPLRAVAVSSGWRSFGRQRTQVAEHLCVLPDLGSWATLRTTTLSPDLARSRPAFELTHFRALPFFGRIRITPGNETSWPDIASGLDDAWRSLLSLPGLEQKLSPQRQPFAYSIGFLPWATGRTDEGSAIVLERVIGSVARVVRRGSEDLDLPGLLCEDETGTKFVLETRDLRTDDVPPTGTLIRFLARRPESIAGSSAPTYETVLPLFTAAVDVETYSAAVATAAVKMYLRLTAEELHRLVGEGSIEGAARACERGWLAQVGRTFYFRYPGLPPGECSVLWNNRRPVTQPGHTIERLRPRIHPLFGWQFDPGRTGHAMSLHFLGGPEAVKAQLSSALTASGSVFVAALGRDALTLKTAVKRLASADSAIRVERCDDEVQRGADQVTRIQYRIARISP
jgi:hypothetical protein